MRWLLAIVALAPAVPAAACPPPPDLTIPQVVELPPNPTLFIERSALVQDMDGRELPVRVLDSIRYHRRIEVPLRSGRFQVRGWRRGGISKGREVVTVFTISDRFAPQFAWREQLNNTLWSVDSNALSFRFQFQSGYTHEELNERPQLLERTEIATIWARFPDGSERIVWRPLQEEHGDAPDLAAKLAALGLLLALSAVSRSMTR